MPLGTLMSSRHSLLVPHTHSYIRSNRTNHQSYRHSNWIRQSYHKTQSGFRPSYRSLNVQRDGRHGEQPCAPSASFDDRPMNYCRRMRMMSHRTKRSHRKMMTNRLMNCFRHCCLSHPMIHKQRSSGGSSPPVHHSTQTLLLKER